MKQISLTKGHVALIDDEDWNELMLWSWHALVMKNGGVYAARSETVKGKKRTVLMHRELARAAKGQLVDHRNLNTLDNRKKNLRWTDKGGNSMNRLKSARPASSQYKGVYYDRHRNSWQSYIKFEGLRRSLGRYSTELEAASAYDRAARRLFGEFANLNLKDAHAC